MNILVAGATGFVGKPLCENLSRSGHKVTAFSRSADSSFFDADVRINKGNMSDENSINEALEDVDTAYYLIHSLTSENFAKKDKKYADRFQKIASKKGVDRVIYLSGISGNENDLSPHLESRREVEKVLSKGTFDLTILRAAIIIGERSASFRIVDDLTDRLPIMIVPRWVQIPCQPIYIEDALNYLVKVLEEPKTRRVTYDIGGPDIVSYLQLLKMTARLKNKKIRIMSVPVMTPGLSAKWLRFTTDVQYSIAKPLVQSMRYPVVVEDSKDLQEVIEIQRTPIENSIKNVLSISG